MQTRESALKLRVHDALVAAVVSRDLNRHDLAKAGHALLSREQFARLLKGPELYAISLDRLADAVEALGHDVEIEVKVRPRAARELPNRHAVPVAA